VGLMWRMGLSKCSAQEYGFPKGYAASGSGSSVAGKVRPYIM
jgi:hypothetical protein